MTRPPRLRLAASLALLALTATMPPVGAQALPAASEPERFELLDPAEVTPALTLPAPPARGSATERAELAHLHALIDTAPPERLAQARADVREDPSIFDTAVGRRLEALPATWALLRTVQNDADLAVSLAKVRFQRTRPYGVDPTLHSCEPGPARPPTKSYPSGHASLAWSVGYVLAQLIPDRAPTILARAADYALSREICAMHFPSDTEASHVVGTIVAVRLLRDPRLAARLAAARAELAAPASSIPPSSEGRR